jgi:hypothetical protein
VKYEVEEIKKQIDRAEGAREALAAMQRQAGSDAKMGELAHTHTYPKCVQTPTQNAIGHLPQCPRTPPPGVDRGGGIDRRESAQMRHSLHEAKRPRISATATTVMMMMMMTMMIMMMMMMIIMTMMVMMMIMIVMMMTTTTPATHDDDDDDD